MTSRLKKFVCKICGKEIKKDQVESDNQKIEKKKYLIENGFVFPSNNMIVSPDGITFCVLDESDVCTDMMVIPEIFCDGEYQFKINQDERGAVFDIGMNIGAATLYFAQMENISRVFSFEPFAPTYRRAMENISRNPHLKPKITTYNIGLGKENKTLEIPYCQDISGDMSTIVDRLDYEERYHDKKHTIEKVEVRNASEILAPLFHSLSDERIILKIDTEGAEFDILESLYSTPLLDRVDFIMMEFHFQSPKTLEKILTDKGFIVAYRHSYHVGAQIGMIYAANIGKINRKQS